MKKWFAFVFVFLASNYLLFSQDDLGKWALTYPKAGEALGDWVKHHPDVARMLFEWDGKHPDNVKELVRWSIEHKHGVIEGFKSSHQDLRGSDILGHHNDAAMNEFMGWCSNYAEAANVLFSHDRGLLWAGNNLYHEYLNTGHRK
jgi:hypothetical protein